MKDEEFYDLQVGDQILHPHLLGGEPVTIVGIHAPKLIVAIISVIATEPEEWKLYRRCVSHEFPQEEPNP